MSWFLFVSVYFLISHSTVSVVGQCTVSGCALSLSGCEESLQFSLEEHDHRLETVNQKMCSAFEKLEAVVNRTNARGQEELHQVLKTMCYNMSINLDSLNEKIPEMFECHTTKEQEEYLRSLNLSMTSMIVRTDERILTVNENLQNINRSLEEKFQVMQMQLQNQSSALQTVSRSLDEKFQVMQVQIQTANRSLDEKLQLKHDLLSSLINESIDAVLRELNKKFHAISSEIDGINEKLNASLDRVKESNPCAESQDHCRNTSVVCDCSDIEANGFATSGVYPIYVVDQGQRYYANAFCDMTTTNGTWTVFQRRENGSVDFYRGWCEYENGFGNPNGEFWLGNNFLHLLTSQRRYRLRIDLEDFEGEKRYAEYSTFNISSSADKYRLGIGTYSGTARNSLGSHSNGKQFTTEDSDNDGKPNINCAVNSRGPWWYHDCNNICGYSNLNGLYLRGNYSSNSSFNGMEGIYWHHWKGRWYSLKTTEMKISSS